MRLFIVNIDHKKNGSIVATRTAIMTRANDNEVQYSVKKSGRAGRAGPPCVRRHIVRRTNTSDSIAFFGLKSNERCSRGRNPQDLEVNLLLLEQEQTRLDTRHEKRSAFEVGVVTPRAVEAGFVVANRVDIEVAYFNRICRV